MPLRLAAPPSVTLALLLLPALPGPARGESLYGYMDLSGQVVLEPRFTRADTFSDGRARVEVDGKYGLIDRDGKLLRGNLHMANPFVGGRMAAQFKEGMKWAYLDRNGDWATTAKFTQAGEFSEGLAAAANDSGFGYIDTAGNWVIPPRYKSARPFTEGLAHVMGENPPAMFIDRAGQVVIPSAGSKVTTLTFRNGFACVENSFMKTWQFIDRAGRKLPHPELSGCWDFEQGYATVTFKDSAKAGGWTGFIDTAGKVVLALPYTHIGAYRNGFAPVRVHTDTCFYTDVTGKVRIGGVDSLHFTSCRPFISGIAPAVPARRDYTLIDTAGRAIVPAAYTLLEIGGGMVAFLPGDGVRKLSAEIPRTPFSTPGGKAASGSKGPGRYVAWKLIRPGTTTGSTRSDRRLEYVEVRSATEPSWREIESAARWRVRFAWVLDQSGIMALEAGQDARLGALRSAFGPMYNSVNGVDITSLGAVEL